MATVIFKLKIIVLLWLAMVGYGVAKIPEMHEENGYIEPFQMFDNVYYIGDKWVSSYAVTTSAGLVIIDTLEFPYSQWLPINLKKLGLQDARVSHILVTHGHSDHVAGANYLQEIYAAEVIISEQGYALAQQQAEQSRGEKKFRPPEVSTFAKDEMSLLIGDSRFKFYLTPGHTQGDMSIDFMAKHRGELYRAFVTGGHSANLQNKQLTKLFIASMSRIKTLSSESPVVTVNLANHPHKNHLFKSREAISTSGMGNPFVNRENFLQFIEQQKEQAQTKLP